MSSELVRALHAETALVRAMHADTEYLITGFRGMAKALNVALEGLGRIECLCPYGVTGKCPRCQTVDNIDAVLEEWDPSEA